jgi:NitT/TauT family transport system permease protein
MSAPTFSPTGAIASKLRTVGLPLLLALSVFVLWEIIVRVRHIPPALLPTPSAVLTRLFDNFALLAKQALPTTLETIVAFAIASVLGIFLAFLVCAWRLARDMLYPNIVVFQLIPKIALAPLFIVWLGIGSQSRVIFSVFISFFPVVVATLTGLLAVDRDLLRLCRAVGASQRNTYLQVRFPAAVPHIFAGLKIAVTFAMIGIIVGEFITAQAGLGYMIMFAASQAEMELILAAITMLCVIGLALYGLVVLAERFALRRYGE